MTQSKSNGTRKTRSAIRIREMDIDDIPVVFHLGERLFEADTMPNMYRTWDEYEVVSQFNTDSEYCLVAEQEPEKTIVGFALGTTIEKYRSAWKYGYLIWLGVEESHQHLGVARRLCRRFRDLMVKNGVRMLLVDTSAENLAALEFFRKQGFGHPQQHVYLSMNLSDKKRRTRKR